MLSGGLQISSWQGLHRHFTGLSLLLFFFFPLIQNKTKTNQKTTNQQTTLYARGQHPTLVRLGSPVTGFCLPPSMRCLFTNYKLLIWLFISVCPCYSTQVPLTTFFAQSVLIKWSDLQLLPFHNGDAASFFPSRLFFPITFLSRMLSHSFPPPSQVRPLS